MWIKIIWDWIIWTFWIIIIIIQFIVFFYDNFFSWYFLHSVWQYVQIFYIYNILSLLFDVRFLYPIQMQILHLNILYIPLHVCLIHFLLSFYMDIFLLYGLLGCNVNRTCWFIRFRIRFWLMILCKIIRVNFEFIKIWSSNWQSMFFF